MESQRREKSQATLWWMKLFQSLLASSFSLLSHLCCHTCTYTANRGTERGEIILEKQFVTRCACTSSITIVICKPPRKTSDPVPEACYLGSVYTDVMTTLLPAILKVHLSPHPSFRSPLEVFGWEEEVEEKKKHISSEIYNRDPSSHPPWCGQLVFCRIFRPPMVFPISN